LLTARLQGVAMPLITLTFRKMIAKPKCRNCNNPVYLNINLYYFAFSDFQESITICFTSSHDLLSCAYSSNASPK
ncbi:MAG: hypothetical protein K0S41_3559, partial [Anaerocolumna sp.]|nr:hypothetical protein [Anaerocolumna sp.]